MRIAVVGTFCAGKTTLVTGICRAMPGSIAVPDECRPVLSRFTQVDWSQPELRSYLIVRQLFVEAATIAENERLIIDGAIINNLAHDLTLMHRPPARAKIINSLGHIRYDLVLWCSPDGVDLVEDGQRYLDPVLREQVHRAIGDVLSEFGYELVEVKGNKHNRLAHALHAIRSLDGAPS